jgi:hypothetical protein
MHLTNANASVFLTKIAFTSYLQIILLIKFNDLKIWHVLCRYFCVKTIFVPSNSHQWNFRGSEMFKILTTVLLILFGCINARATVLTFDTSITGADMIGIGVTATFADNSTETIFWESISTDLGNSGNDVIDYEGYKGGVIGTNWSLTQQGFTLGNFGDGNTYGAWSFTNDNAGITGLKIDTTNTDIMFDTATFETILQDTNGSGQGRSFLTEQVGVTHVYSGNVQQELYKILELSGLTGENFDYLADTDKQDDNATAVDVIDTVEIVNIDVPPTDITTVELIAADPINTAIAAYLGTKTTAELLAAVSNLDLGNLPVLGTPEQEQELAAALEVAQVLMEAKFKEASEGKVEGNGDIAVAISRDSGEVTVALTIEDPTDTSAPLRFTRLLDTPLFAFNINFDFEFTTTGGLLEVFLNEQMLLSFNALDYGTKSFGSYFVDDSQFFGLTDAELRYDLFPGSPANVLLSNINLTAVIPAVEAPEPAPILILMSGLLCLIFTRKKVSGE